MSIYTDLSNPEKLINMVYYIVGDEVIQKMYKIKAFYNNWDNKATEEINEEIIEEIKKMFN